MRIIPTVSAGGFQASIVNQPIFSLPVSAGVGPTEVLCLTTETLLLDATGLISDHGVVTIQNLGPNPIFIALNADAASGPTVTTGNGIEIAADGSHTFDKIGGAAIWGITTVNQTTGNGTRVGGVRR